MPTPTHMTDTTAGGSGVLRWWGGGARKRCGGFFGGGRHAPHTSVCVAFSMAMATAIASVSRGVSAFTIWMKDTVRRMAARLEKPSDMANSTPMGTTLRATKRHSMAGTLSTPATRSAAVASVAKPMWMVVRDRG